MYLFLTFKRTFHTFGQLKREDLGPDEDPLGSTVIVLLEIIKAVISASILSQCLKTVNIVTLIGKFTRSFD